VSLGKLKRRLFRARLSARRVENRRRFLRQMVKLSNFGFPRGLGAMQNVTHHAETGRAIRDALLKNEPHIECDFAAIERRLMEKIAENK
jgi:hypothetical protein